MGPPERPLQGLGTLGLRPGAEARPQEALQLAAAALPDVAEPHPRVRWLQPSLRNHCVSAETGVHWRSRTRKDPDAHFNGRNNEVHSKKTSLRRGPLGHGAHVRGEAQRPHAPHPPPQHEVERRGRLERRPYEIHVDHRALAHRVRATRSGRSASP